MAAVQQSMVVGKAPSGGRRRAASVSKSSANKGGGTRSSTSVSLGGPRSSAVPRRSNLAPRKRVEDPAKRVTVSPKLKEAPAPAPVTPARRPAPLPAAPSSVVPGGMEVPEKLQGKRECVKEACEDPGEFPREFRSLSRREEVLFGLAETFQRQYEQLYPARTKLLLAPPNEVGQPKFVCTTIRPFELPYEELHDAERCAAFVADYVTYETLDPPTKLPPNLLSPWSTLRWRVGDALDMSLLLVSLLLGVGYDAYVVCGYATREVTHRDLSLLEGPEKKEAREEAERQEALEKAKPLPPPPKFVTLERTNLKSSFQERMAKKEAEREAAEKAKQEEEDRKKEVEAQELLLNDPLRGRRVHCWVLVKPGKRGVEESFFIEVTTGRKVPRDFSGYTGVECLFNNANYWVNMQPADPSGTIKNVSFNLDDVLKWEHLLVPPPVVSTRPSQPLDKSRSHAPQEEAEAEEDDPWGSDHGSHLLQDALKVFEMPPSWVPPLELTKEQFANRYPTRSKTAQYRDSATEVFFARPDGLVRRITNYEDQLVSKPLLDEEGKTRPPKALHVCETYEGRTDKMHSRTLLYDAHRVRKAIDDESFYGSAAEGLEMFTEEFLPGRTLGMSLKRLEVIGYHVCSIVATPHDDDIFTRKTPFPVQYKLEFYTPGRTNPDETEGIVRRDVVVGRRIVEEFQDRDDLLISRAIAFRPPDDGPEAGAEWDEDEPPVVPDVDTRVAMEEIFGQDPDVPADESLARRWYRSSLNRTELWYHLIPGHIEPSRRTYEERDKTARVLDVTYPPEELSPTFMYQYQSAQLFAKERGAPKGLVATPSAATLKEYAEFVRLSRVEAKCADELRHAARHTQHLLRLRVTERQETVPPPPVLRPRRVRKKESEDDEEVSEGAPDEEKVDPEVAGFLWPYIKARLGGRAPRTYQEAELIKNDCLHYHKNRLCDKADILSHKLSAAEQRIKELEDVMLRHADHVHEAEMDSFEVEANRRKFQMRVMVQRQRDLYDNAVADLRRIDEDIWNHVLLRDLLNNPDG